ncbi:GTP cyclohydrolase I FolE [Salinigranum marinum]|uniref:GTP cyclohydrolase I n=1 Tax=Salinigranum marinum TaxID=1515595 RepID=UPI002989EC7B|nr:GTP cyclohydrolase I FolE [Salinigranum marinum]
MPGDTNGELQSTSESFSEIDWEKAQEGTRLLLEAVGADSDQEHLQDTWQRRVPQAFETLTEGHREVAKPTMRTFPSEDTSTVIKTGIPVYSLCEHHLLPYYGTAHVAYVPNGAVVGLSKLPRYIRWQSRRLTMQESLTRDIAEGLRTEIGATGVIVELTATHLCEAMRGVERATETTTRAVEGQVTDAVKRQFERAIDKNTRS